MAKKYNPWTGFLEDTADKANDAMMFVQLRFGSGKIEGAKLDESEFRDYAEALLKKYNEKIVTLSKNGRAIATYTAHDEKPTIDKAISNCDEEQYYKFMLRGGAEYYGTESDMREFFSHLTSKEKKELGTNYKSKTPMSKEEVERWRRNAMNKLGL